MTTSQVSLERRAAQRFDIQVPVSVRLAGDDCQALAFTQDLSARGAFFFTDLLLTEDAEIELTLVMPAEIMLAEKMRVRCRGTVLRAVKPPVGSKIGVAVHFAGYEFLPQTQDASEVSADFGRISALHDHAHGDQRPAAASPTFHRGAVLP